MTNEISASEVEVRWQETPNPFALKFVVNKSLKDEGKATFLTKEESKGLPMVNSLLDVLGVKQVYMQGNSLTLSHDGQMETDNIVDAVKSILKTRMTIHDPTFKTVEESDEALKPQEIDRSNLPKELVEIEEVLDRTIRPGLYADGGDDEVISYRNISKNTETEITKKNKLDSVYVYENLFELKIDINANVLTFPTKDIFAKAACHIARGGTPEVIGARIKAIKSYQNPRPTTQEKFIRGTVIHIDSYGNAITNISKKIFIEIGKNRPFSIEFRNYNINKLYTSYSEVKHEGEKLALFNTNNDLEISVNRGVEGYGGSATNLLGLGLNEIVTVTFT